MGNEKIRGLFLARPVSAGNTRETLRTLTAAEGFGSPEDDLTITPGEAGWDVVTVRTEMGENLLACARWRGVLELRKAPRP
jgi:hypothetical protein